MGSASILVASFGILAGRILERTKVLALPNGNREKRAELVEAISQQEYSPDPLLRMTRFCADALLRV